MAAENRGIEGEYIVVMKDVPTNIRGGNSFSTSQQKEKSSLSTQALQTMVFDIADRVGGIDEIQLYTHSMRGFFVRGIDAKMAEEIAQDKYVAFVEQNQVFSKSMDNVLDQSPVTWSLDCIDEHSFPLDDTYNVIGDGTCITTYIIDTGS